MGGPRIRAPSWRGHCPLSREQKLNREVPGATGSGVALTSKRTCPTGSYLVGARVRKAGIEPAFS